MVSEGLSSVETGEFCVNLFMIASLKFEYFFNTKFLQRSRDVDLSENFII